MPNLKHSTFLFASKKIGEFLSAFATAIRRKHYLLCFDEKIEIGVPWDGTVACVENKVQRATLICKGQNKMYTNLMMLLAANDHYTQAVPTDM